MNTNPKTKRADAERAAEWYARERLECVLTRRAVRTKWQSVDFFAADVVGKRQDGSHVYIQATAGQSESLRVRRRKLERVPWHESDAVLVLQLTWTPDPANARRRKWWFRVHHFTHDEDPRGWCVSDEAIPVPQLWFTAWTADKALKQRERISA